MPIYQAAPPILSSHLVEAWMRIRADLQAEDPDRQLTGLVLIRKLLSSTGRTKHMQVRVRVRVRARVRVRSSRAPAAPSTCRCGLGFGFGLGLAPLEHRPYQAHAGAG